ncbi:hypothetical protein [Bosea sp. PAMC 26642]|uniref:hypothetical protein n=1 Tax=Bosea sp. (strain PAMC 26642) TaxID=1792307 RepID=UPI0007704C9B|nr:hypothetical protein [Bosea sp. PAMC 26642]AMJ59123.1 hypothetical protein AXW83_01330 [Bosea sp. PAMC 26642]
MMLGKATAVLIASAFALHAIPAQAQTADQLVGRWGLASYFRDAAAPQVAAAAASQCGAPYIIGKGPSGGVMLHRPDESRTSEHVVKSSLLGKSYIGPAGEAGGAKDREIVSYDGTRLVLRWVDASVAGRYGTMVFVRCKR